MVVVVHDHVVVFGVNHEYAAVPSDLVHDYGEPAEVCLVVLHLRAGRPDAGGEYLETGVAVLHEFAYLSDYVVLRSPREDGMVGVIGVGVAAPTIGCLAEGVVEVMTGGLGCEVQNCGRTAVNGGEGYRRCRGAFGLAGTTDVGVWLDAAGDDYFAGGVYALVGFEVDAARIGDGDDFLAVNSYVEVADASGGYDLTAVNDDVNHVRPPLSVRVRVVVAGLHCCLE